MQTSHKIIISGSVAEVFWFGRDLEVSSFDPKQVRKANSSVWVRRLVSANVGQWLDEKAMEFYRSYFVTLTFAENLQDLNEANRHFKRFIEKLSKRFDFQPAYLCVPEFQERGAVHYHVLFFNLSRYEYPKYMSEIWIHGYVMVRPVDDFQNVAWYMAKYMTKDSNDKRYKGHRRYSVSRNVLRPRVSYDEAYVIDFLDAMFEGSLRLTSEYESEYTGLTKYQVFDISEHPIRYSRALLPHGKVRDDEEYVTLVDKSVDNSLFLWKK